MRGSYTAASCIALAAALTVCAGPALGQQAAVSGPNTAPDVVNIYGDRQIQDPGSYSVVDEKKIESVQANHVAEILNTVPGVNVQMNSGQEMLVAIRSPVLSAGAGQGSFLVLEDGVPIRGSAFGNVNELFEVQHETAQAIEVVRGPGSVKYGSNAVHGLINVIDPEPGAQTGSTLEASLNTLQRYRGDATTNLSVGGADIWAGFSAMHDGGWRDSSGVDQQKLTVRSGWHGDDWKVVGTLSAVNLNQETAGYIQGHDVYKDEDIAKTNPNPEAYRDAWAAHANVRIEKSFGDNLLTITPFALTQRMIFIQHFLPDQSTEKNGQDSYGVLTRYDFGPDNLRWSVGFDAQYADGKLKEIQSRPTFGAFPTGVHYDYDVKTTSLAAYGELNWKFATDWSLLGGVRVEGDNYDYTTYKTPGVYGRYLIAPSRSDDFHLVTPKLGVTYSGFKGVELYANYARGERAPQASDQYRLQNQQTIGRLDVEKLDSFEIGARGDVAGVHYDIAAYHMQKINFFFRDSDGLNVPNGKTHHTGIETSFNGKLGEAFGGEIRWNANVTWTDQTYAFNRPVANANEVIVDGNQIDTAPEWQGDAGIGWENKRFSLYLSGQHVGEYYMDAANLNTYPGHTIADLRATWRFTDQLEAFGIIRNLTDQRYADRADIGFGQERYFPGEPVNLTLGVRVRG